LQPSFDNTDKVKRKYRAKHTDAQIPTEQRLQQVLQLPVLLTLDLFQETEQCSKQAADDRHRVTGLYEVELEHALETVYAPLSTAMQSH